jgi:hypothetical protein
MDFSLKIPSQHVINYFHKNCIVNEWKNKIKNCKFIKILSYFHIWVAFHCDIKWLDFLSFLKIMIRSKLKQLVELIYELLAKKFFGMEI